MTIDAELVDTDDSVPRPDIEKLRHEFQALGPPDPTENPSGNLSATDPKVKFVMASAWLARYSEPTLPNW